VLKPGGILVSLTEEPPEEQARSHGVRAIMIGVEPDGTRLEKLAALIDEGELRPHMHAIFPLDQARQALELSRTRHIAGKIVLIP
jgi:NADPH2:quinone reductase